jgi:four helix bundle protein
MAMIDHLPKSTKGRVIADQVIRSATSVAANYRAACRARSRAEFIAKLGTVVEEVDETAFWLELIVEAGLLPPKRIEGLSREADELAAILFSAQRTARNTNPKS